MGGDSLSLAPCLFITFFIIAILAAVLLSLPTSDVARYEDMDPFSKSVCDLRHPQSTPPAIWCR